MPRRARPPLFDPELFGEQFAGRISERAVERYLDIFQSGEEMPDFSGYDEYPGRRIVWMGEPGHMLRATWDQLHATQGNIFDWNKVIAIARYMSGDERTIFFGPPARDQGQVNETEVGDTQQAAVRRELFDAHGMTRPFTTGSAELDEFLRDRDDLLAEMKRMEKRGDDIRAAKRSLLALDKRVAVASRRKDGDLGTTVFGLRNGNHRAAAAYLIGEPYIWVHVQNATFEKLL